MLTLTYDWWISEVSLTLKKNNRPCFSVIRLGALLQMKLSMSGPNVCECVATCPHACLTSG